MTLLYLLHDPPSAAQTHVPRSRLSSIAAHAIVIAVLFAASMHVREVSRQPIFAKHYTVQLVRLTIRPSPYRPRPVSKPSAQKERRAFNTGKAAQTLIVPNSPPDTRLEKPLPLPSVVPEISPSLSGMPPVPQTQRADILSRPADPIQAAATIVVPKVNQVAEGGGSPGPPDASPPTSGLDPVLGRISRIDLSPTGQFPVSLLGPSVTADHPELTTPLSGKIVSTVYIKVGTRKNWSLEFWAPGNPPPDAPWAYRIFRPDTLQIPIETDALLITGKLNTNGHLENLEIVLPSGWPAKDALLRVLERWTFRPASRNGTPLAVDVLIVIPNEQAEQ